MIIRALALLPAILPICMVAAEVPQFLWEGDVDQTVTLYIRGDQLKTASTRGVPAEHQRWRFFRPLPDSRNGVRQEVQSGRGAVVITQQPTLANSYLAAVQIDDPQDGRSHYSIALYWESDPDTAHNWKDRGWQSDSSAPRAKTPTGRLTWRGHVDGDVMVECQSTSCRSSVIGGMPVSRERTRFTRPLPQAEVAVSLVTANPYIQVQDQPLPSNDYTARVRITDECGGKKDCSFTLEWRQPDAEATPEKTPAQRGLVWSGRVSGTVRVMVRGASTMSEVLSGGPTTNEQSFFDRPLPPRQAGLTPAVRKLQGRGDVSIVEEPSEKNSYTLLFEIRDPGRGADDYAVEVDW